MAHSRFVNAFSRISKNYVFRFQIVCHILFWCYRLFVFVAGWGGGGVGVGEHLVLYPITMYSFKSEIQRQPTMFERAKFCACACNQE